MSTDRPHGVAHFRPRGTGGKRFGRSWHRTDLTKSRRNGLKEMSHPSCHATISETPATIADAFGLEHYRCLSTMVDGMEPRIVNDSAEGRKRTIERRYESGVDPIPRAAELYIRWLQDKERADLKSEGATEGS